MARSWVSLLLWTCLAWHTLANAIPPLRNRVDARNAVDLEVRANDRCSPSDRMFSTETMPAGSFMPWEFMLPGSSIGSTKYYVTIVNLTPYRLVKTGQHSYQFDVFDFGDVPSGKFRQNTMVYTTRAGANAKDDNGEAHYRLDGTGKTFSIRGTTHIPDSYPMRTVVDLSGMGLGQREYGNPAPQTSVTLVITGSEDYGYITSLAFGASNWMHQLYDVIKDRELRHIVMPGSHDAGMSTISQAWVRLGSAANTQTQGLTIYDQLRVGSRYFDMRLVSVNGGNDNFWAAHVSDERSDLPVGATGESLNDIILGINRFTSESPGEIIILWVRYMVNLDDGGQHTRYWDASQADAFYSKLEGIRNRCLGLDSTNTKFDRLKAQTLLDSNSGAGCVLIMTDGSLQSGVPGDRPSSGIYYGPKYLNRRDDFWANKADTASLASAQTSHMVDTANRRDGDDGDRFAIMQWQCTPDVVAATLYGLSSIAILPTNPALYWAGMNAMTPEAWPTVILQDYVGLIHRGETEFPGQLGAEIRALVMGLNLYMVSQNCDVSGRRNPLLRGRVAGRVAAAPSAVEHGKGGEAKFTGIIYANGTVDVVPPRGFHLGRVETLRNGTVFGNGTVLRTGDKRNPLM